MKQVSRRDFGRWVGGAVLVPGIARAGGLRPVQEKPVPKPETTEAGKPEAKLKLTPEQEDRVKKALERREKMLAGMRNRPLPYSLEPAFVFRVQPARASRRKGE